MIWEGSAEILHLPHTQVNENTCSNCRLNFTWLQRKQTPCSIWCNTWIIQRKVFSGMIPLYFNIWIDVRLFTLEVFVINTWNNRFILQRSSISLDFCNKKRQKQNTLWHTTTKQMKWDINILRYVRIYMYETWWRHQMETFPRYWPFVWGIHRSPVNSPHKGQWGGALMFSCICARINGWIKIVRLVNRDAIAPIITSL